MTQEEKTLLFQDLSARLFYGVKVKCGDTVTKEICELVGINAEISTLAIRDRWAKYYLENVDSIKPYLRPMSSMTEEERKELSQLLNDNSLLTGNPSRTIALHCSVCTDYFNKKMLDYRGLIEKGLALEAPEGMYN